MTLHKKIVDIEQYQSLSFNSDEQRTIKKTVAQGATDDEMVMFLHICKTYGLDPFNKEIWFIKDNNQEPIIMTSRDGYLKIAARNPAFDGLVSDVVRKDDSFKRSSEGVQHEYGTNRGTIIGAYALVYRKDRKYPVYTFAPFEEYRAGTKVWNQYPSAMILKVAESMALKRAFTVSGLVSFEEMEARQYPNVIIEADNQNRKEARKLSEREKVIKEILGDKDDLRKEMYEYLDYAKRENKLQKISINDLSDQQYRELKNRLSSTKTATQYLA